MSREFPGKSGFRKAASRPAARPHPARDAASSASPAGLRSVPTTKVFAVGRVPGQWTPDALRPVMPREVRETVELYLHGRIEQWFFRKDQPGVVFVFASADVEEVHDLLERLPLGPAGMMDFDLIPVGPLAPLGLLLSPLPGGTPPRGGD